ncbi:zinc ribbon domain-containing protein [Thermococcus aggregans]|uniref:Zinc ribbon domain-containing protein n=1 Tax=Thermococcus aggregans TaxID=110163 RepID=A0A9E7N0L6_THEAG|nr:zinc ribbon domain-containing protein [Thermococcus aggregans]USS41797.1 zinc ribbon domain-containing protein [Thermococcus aggregans]
MIQMERQHLKCPLCGGTSFKVEEGKLDSKWGFTAHKVKIVICETCGYVMMFYKGRTIWDFD